MNNIAETQTQPIQVQITVRQKSKGDDDSQTSFQMLAEKLSSRPSFQARRNWMSFKICDETEVTSFFNDEGLRQNLDETVNQGVVRITLKRDDSKYQGQLATLSNKGFNRRGQNIRLLKKFDGEMDKVVEVLEARKAQNCNQHEFNEKLVLLENKGFNRRAQNIRLLKKFDGEMDKVVEVLEARKAQNCNQHEFNEKLVLLENKGFNRRAQNIRLLKKFDGEVDKVAEVLEAQKARNTAQCSKFEEQLQVLAERGFNKRGRNKGLLHRFDGDVEQVIQFLQEKNGQRNTNQGRKECNLKELQFSSQLQQLEEMGFDKRKQNIRLLNRFEGDVQRVTSFLLDRQRGGKRSNLEEDLERYQAQLQVLKELGYTNTKLNVRLLRRFNGEVDKVANVLLTKQDRSLKKQNHLDADLETYKVHLNVLKGMGYTNEKLNLRLVKRFDGDLKQVVPVLRRKKMK